MSKRILYIEDDLVDQKIFQRTLLESDVQIDIANTFEAAYQFQANHTYDLVVSDLHLGPDELLDEIHNWDNSKLIILSNQIDNKALAPYICFEKPFKIEMLSASPAFSSDVLSTSQLEALCGDDAESKKQLVDLIEQELVATKSKLTEISSASCKEKSAVIHKALNKIAILGMKQSRFQLLAYEKQLSSETPLSPDEDVQISYILDTALNYLKQIRA